MDTKLLKTKFETVFSRQDGELFFAPGRINLIGEHTDYNGGHVFPCAITIGTYAVSAKERIVKFDSTRKIFRKLV